MVEPLLRFNRAFGEGEARERQIFLNETNTISGDLGASLFVGNVDLIIAETDCSRPSLPFPLPFPLPFVGCLTEA